MKIALVVPGGFEHPDAPRRPRSIPALHALTRRLAREHEVHVFQTDFDQRRASWPMLGATVHDPGRVATLKPPGARTLERSRRLFLAMREAARDASFDVMHAFFIDGNGVAATLAALGASVPLVASVSGGECVDEPSIDYGNARTLAGRMGARFVLGSAHVVTVGSRTARAHVKRSSVEIVPLGADASIFKGPVKRPLGPPWRLAHVASRNRVKDPWTLLEAIRSLVSRGLDVQLDWIGGDTLSGAVEARARTLGLDARIHFQGQIPQESVAARLASAHLHVISSRYESQCVAALEAALAGVPTVGSHVGLLADLSPDAAMTVPPASPFLLADAIARMLERHDERLNVARAAQEYARKYDADWTARTFLSIYETLLPLRGAGEAIPAPVV